ncbi:hypothetical protein DL93DRAFT_117705 [Clavulina sp. PMI_390]|nr:hypothetical protein DL93DRAFT_117705 [Clavulina sp. PMI_390]
MAAVSATRLALADSGKPRRNHYNGDGGYSSDYAPPKRRVKIPVDERITPPKYASGGYHHHPKHSSPLRGTFDSYEATQPSEISSYASHGGRHTYQPGSGARFYLQPSDKPGQPARSFELPLDDTTLSRSSAACEDGFRALSRGQLRSAAYPTDASRLDPPLSRRAVPSSRKAAPPPLDLSSAESLRRSGLPPSSPSPPLTPPPGYYENGFCRQDGPSGERVFTRYPGDSPPRLADDCVRIVCISDTHGSALEIPDGDMLIHTGDLSDGSEQGLMDTYHWLRSQPHTVKLFVLICISCSLLHANPFLIGLLPATTTFLYIAAFSKPTSTAFQCTRMPPYGYSRLHRCEAS